MQQYFINQKFDVGDNVLLDKDSLYHLKKVLRKDSSYTFRVVSNENKIFHCHLVENDNVHIDKYLDENNELDVDITCILSLIKVDKLELTIQKLVELGIKRIVLLNTNRCVAKVNDSKKIDRLNKIIKEACEQSHRNIIPELLGPINIKDLDLYKSKNNYLCYESEDSFNNVKGFDESISYIIGPEGGFEDKEVIEIINKGYKSVSLGKRILRAETAAIYMTSVIVGNCQ